MASGVVRCAISNIIEEADLQLRTDSREAEKDRETNVGEGNGL